jgi:hypothetical protein
LPLYSFEGIMKALAPCSNNTATSLTSQVQGVVAV